jgi:glycerol-3-phosphate O-acyltransferase
MTITLTLGWLLVGLAAYELVRFLIVGTIKRWLRAGAIQFVRQHRVRLESARFIDRLWLRERLAWDPQIEQAILDAARRTGEPIPVLRHKVDRWVEEIAPYFSISTYYQFGAAVAKRFVNFCFEMVVDHEGFERQSRAVPEGAVRVYVINHRSNFDPVVLAFGLLRHVAISYAVGEWALVWPLSSLFRAFGGYFVRRGEGDKLYHAVLERFVQLLAGHGAVTGFFIEGGLSRDGLLRKPRTGLLEYYVKLRREFPEREIVFLPVGLNYDRVLEDRHLVADVAGKKPRPMLIWRLWNLVALLFWVPILIVANMLKVATRSHQKFGYAAISFGEPLRLTDWPGGSTVHSARDEDRKRIVGALGEELLYRRVARVVPVTPVAAVSVAMLRPGPMDSASLVGRIRDVVAELRATGAPFALGDAFHSIEERRKDTRRDSNIPDLDRGLLDAEEAELMLLLTVSSMLRRRVIRKQKGAIEILEGEVVRYYANSVLHHLEPNLLLARSDGASAASVPALAGRVETAPL